MAAISHLEPPSVTWRVIVTLVLLVICLLGLVTGYLQPDRELLVGTAAGLLVLATAGMWVSYCAHFEFLWSVGACFVVGRELIEELRAAQRSWPEPESPVPLYLRTCRPDLFEPAAAPAEE